MFMYNNVSEFIVPVIYILTPEKKWSELDSVHSINLCFSISEVCIIMQQEECMCL